MNDDRLEKLLEQKRSSRPVFTKSGEGFAADFFRKVRETPMPSRRWHWTAWAAGLLVAVGVAAAMLLPLTRAPYVCTRAAQYEKLAETVRLFGNRAAVFFFGDELITGERDEESGPVNFINIDLAVNRKLMRLSLACFDDDSIRLTSDAASGTVVVSRSDAGTLVVDLEIRHNGECIRLQVPVEKLERKYYYGSAEV